MPTEASFENELPLGSIVKFRVPQSEDEAQERFVVVEHRGERILVEYICDMALKPQSVYLGSELMIERS